MTHLETIVPFLQLTYQENADPQGLYPYRLGTLIMVPAGYHFIGRLTENLTNNGEETDTLVRYSFLQSQGYENPGSEIFTEFFNMVDFHSMHPSGTAGRGLTVEVALFNDLPEGLHAEPMTLKTGKMRLEDAEVGVDPEISFRFE